MLYIEYVCYMLNTAKFENETKVVFFSPIFSPSCNFKCFQQETVATSHLCLSSAVAVR